MGTTITQQTLVPRGADRRQSNEGVEVDRRAQERRSEGAASAVAPQANSSPAADASNISSEAQTLGQQAGERAGQMAARASLKSTLGGLLAASPSKPAATNAAAAPAATNQPAAPAKPVKKK